MMLNVLVCSTRLKVSLIVVDWKWSVVKLYRRYGRCRIVSQECSDWNGRSCQILVGTELGVHRYFDVSGC